MPASAGSRMGRLLPYRFGTWPALPGQAHRASPDYGRTASPDWRSIDWPAHLGSVTVCGRKMTYVDLGRHHLDEPGGRGHEPAVLFIHGLGGNWQNWLENLPRVAQERRAIAMDLPGFGTSEMPADKISISSYARWIDEFCEEIDLGHAVVVGNSMGGFIGAELAISYPARVERLVLVGAAGISITASRRRPVLTFAQIITAIAAAAAARRREVVARPRLRHFILAAVMRHPSRLRADLLAEITQGAGAPGFAGALDALMSYDFSDRLPEIACPTLIVWGNRDVLVPLPDAEEFERLIPDSRRVVFDDTGHTPMLERPIEFNDRLLEFLAERAGAEAGKGGGETGADGAEAGKETRADGAEAGKETGADGAEAGGETGADGAEAGEERPASEAGEEGGLGQSRSERDGERAPEGHGGPGGRGRQASPEAAEASTASGGAGRGG